MYGMIGGRPDANGDVLAVSHGWAVIGLLFDRYRCAGQYPTLEYHFSLL